MQENTITNYSHESDLFVDQAPTAAGFWERLVASFLDGLIVTIAYFLSFFILGPFAIVIGLVLPWLYAAIMESGESQATLGKRALGIKVINTDGGRLSFAQATGRHFGKFVSVIILYIGFLMMLWDERSQTLHDKMANALVIKR